MSKPKPTRAVRRKTKPRRRTRMLRVSPQKLNLVAQLIRGKKVATALADLEFSSKRISVEVKKTLESAIANAENNHELDVDDLVVAQAWVGKGIVMKRFSPRAAAGLGGSKSRSPTSRSSCAKSPAEPRRLRRHDDGTENQSDRAAPRRQPHLGFALVLQQGRIRQAACTRT